MKRLMILSLLLLMATLAFAQIDFSADRVELEMREGFTVVGYELRDSMETSEMMKLWERFLLDMRKVPNAIEGPLFGISYYADDFDPETMLGLCYMAGVPVSDLGELPEGMTAHTVPTNYYAIFTHKGPGTKVPESFNSIFGEWMPSTGNTPLMGDIIEEYGHDYKHDSEESILKIWVPIVKQ